MMFLRIPVCVMTIGVLFFGDVPRSLAAEPQQQGNRQLLIKFRQVRGDAKRRLAAIEEIAQAGPETVALLRDLLEKEIDRLDASLPEGPNTKALDEQIESLRKVLADLRADPNLSKEQTHNVGLPALDQLTNLWRQREAIHASHYSKLTRQAAQAQQLADLFAQVAGRWPTDPPLPVDQWIPRVEKMLAKAHPPIDEEAKRVYAENQRLAAEIPADCVAGMNAVNAMRVMCGLRPLVFDPKLCQTAVDHSKDMEKLGFFAHESPVEGKKTPWDRAAKFGTTASGENIYMGSSVNLDAIKAWFLSPGHHKNMLGEGHKRQGLGRSGKHWTQLFGA